MKKSFIEHLPVLFAFSAIMLIMATLSAFYSKTIAIIQAFIAVIAIVVFSLVFINFKSNIKELFIKTAKDIDMANTADINKFNLPALVFSSKGDILWANKRFINEISDDIIGSHIENIMDANDIEKLKKEVCISIRYKNQFFTCFGAMFKKTMTVYFYNDTQVKQKADNYDSSRPVVLSILFDNKKELLDDIDDQVAIQIVAMVESKIKNWANETSGIFRRLSSGNYLFITEQQYLDKFKESKFKIIDEIHQAKLDEKNYATLSVGVGYGANTLKECEEWSKKALDMALGRGGDQVAIKNGPNFEFFGGLSQGTAKREMVRTRVIASAIVNHINQSSNVLIMGHKFADLDSLGACVGVWSASYKGLNIPSYIVVDRKETSAINLIENLENKLNKNAFITPKEAIEKCNDDSLLIITDTHNPDFLESKQLYEKCKRTIVIDHHRMMVSKIENALIFYHEPYASSACELVTELIQYMSEYTINRVEAEALIAGIMLDTKNFIVKTGVRTFEAAAFLRRRGADTVQVKRMFSDSLEAYKARFEIVAKAEIFNKCAVSFAQLDNDKIQLKLLAAQAADEILNIQGVKASFVIFPIPDGISISARSFGDVNVQLIMEKFGGGGHQTMAGAQIYGQDISYVKELLVSVINNTKID